MILRGFEKIKDVKDWHQDTKIETTITALTKRQIKAKYLPDRLQAVKYIKSVIPEKSIIGLGGSATIAEIGLMDELEKYDFTILSSFCPNLSKEEQFDIMRQSMNCDVFLSSTNAITLDGRLINIDGTGNRVAGMIFGPKKTIIVAGKNKIVDSIDDGINRIKNIAAPMNIRRYFKPDRVLPPCTTTGKCMNCNPPLRICNVTSIIEGKPFGIELEVVLIGEDLGF